MAFFDIVKEQQNTEEVKKIKLVGIDFLGEDIEIEANTSFMFNLIVSMSEEINSLATKDLNIELDTDSLIDSMGDLEKIKKTNNKVIEKKLFKGAKEEIKKQLKSAINGTLSTDATKSLEKLEDEIYQKYFFELPGVPSEEEFFKYLVESRGMKVTDDNIEMFRKMALLNKMPHDKVNKLMNVYETNLYEIRKCIEETTGMALDFNRHTQDEGSDSAF